MINTTPLYLRAEKITAQYKELFQKRMIDTGYINIDNTKELCSQVETLLQALDKAYAALEVTSLMLPDAERVLSVCDTPWFAQEAQADNIKATIKEVRQAQQEILELLGDGE